jgi:hypothetical protein
MPRHGARGRPDATEQPLQHLNRFPERWKPRTHGPRSTSTQRGPAVENFCGRRTVRRRVTANRGRGKGWRQPMTPFFIALGSYLATLMLALAWWARFPR